MTGVLYIFLGAVSLGLLIICAYFLLRKERKPTGAVAPMD
jgi:hypothetical protein